MPRSVQAKASNGPGCGKPRRRGRRGRTRRRSGRARPGRRRLAVQALRRLRPGATQQRRGEPARRHRRPWSPRRGRRCCARAGSASRPAAASRRRSCEPARSARRAAPDGGRRSVRIITCTALAVSGVPSPGRGEQHVGAGLGENVRQRQRGPRDLVRLPVRDLGRALPDDPCRCRSGLRNYSARAPDRAGSSRDHGTRLRSVSRSSFSLTADRLTWRAKARRLVARQQEQARYRRSAAAAVAHGYGERRLPLSESPSSPGMPARSVTRVVAPSGRPAMQNASPCRVTAASGAALAASGPSQPGRNRPGGTGAR